MGSLLLSTEAAPASAASNGSATLARPMPVLLSFDIEEHHRIEEAMGMPINDQRKSYYRDRMETTTRWILEILAARQIQATFFIVGEIAQTQPGLIKEIHRAGHEIASHGWDHRRVHHFTAETFREDVTRSKTALEQLTGAAVYGYRAPTFSITKHTAWALDELVEAGFAYDSSIYPVYHDRYGIPNAPRGPFLARGARHEIMEMPPATLRMLGTNLPSGGGGYFRLFPLFILEHALKQLGRSPLPSAGMLYFHPWEFDPDQARLPLGRFGSFRTYVGMSRTRGRFERLLSRYVFGRTIDEVRLLEKRGPELPRFDPVLQGSDSGGR
jgi:polysaccharide deacetylase family protein (PEP-CTERM system associated)